MRLDYAINRALKLPDKETIIDVGIDVSDEDANRIITAIRFFSNKRRINILDYKYLDIDEAIYRLQIKYPEFCLLTFWFDNGVSKQQSQFIEEHGMDYIYGPQDLMRAYWGSGLCSSIRENQGAVWPIMGYTKEIYNSLTSEDTILKSQIDSVINDYREYETIWNEPIVFLNGWQVVGYAMFYTRLLNDIAWAYDIVNFDIWASNYLFGDGFRAVSNNIIWYEELLRMSNFGNGRDTAYNIIKATVCKKYPKIFHVLEQDEVFKIGFDNSLDVNAKGLMLKAKREGRELTEYEKRFIQSNDDAIADIGSIEASAKRRENCIDALYGMKLPDDIHKLKLIVGELSVDVLEALLIELAGRKFWYSNSWQNMLYLEREYKKISSNDAIYLYINTSLSEALINRKLRAMTRSYNVAPLSSVSDSCLLQVADMDERYRFRMAREWINCLCEKPNIAHREVLVQ